MNDLAAKIFPKNGAGKTVGRLQQGAKKCPAASRRPGLLLWRQLSFRLSLRRKFHPMIWVSSCEGNNSNISHVGFH
jgi:hypothetical protein